MKHWTQEEAAVWLERLTNFEIASDEARMKWDWIAPGWQYEPYKSHAVDLIEYSLQREELQRAIEYMAGPHVHLPGLLWLIWNYVYLDTHTAESDEERKTITAFLSKISRISSVLQDIQMEVVELRNYANEREESIAVRFAKDYEPPVTYFAAAEINRLSHIVDWLSKSMDELDLSKRRLWEPMRPEMTGAQVQRFDLHLTFYIVNQMKGNHCWKSVTEIMNAVSHLQGHHASRYNARTIEESYKALRKTPESFQQSEKGWEALIQSKRKYMASALDKYVLDHP